MKQKPIQVSIAIVFLVMIVTSNISWADALKRQVFINGTILTMDAHDRIVSGLAIEGDKIVAVGTSEEIMDRYRQDAVVNNLAGKTVLPGFVDAHSHFPSSGLSVIGVDLNSPPIGTLLSIKEMQDRLRAKVASTEDGKWIFGFGYDDTLLKEVRHPTREDLDAVSTKHPIYVWHISGHMGVANSRALALAGIDRSTQNPPGGVIERDAQGDATGLLQETAASKVQALALKVGFLELSEMSKQATKDYLEQGVTTAQNGAVSMEAARDLSQLSRLGIIPLRLVLWPVWNAFGADIPDGKIKLARYESERLTLGAAKFFSDGSIQGYTAFLGHPYHKPYHGDSSYRGFPTMAQNKLDEEIGRFHRAGMQLAIHANGDAAIDSVLDAIEKAQRSKPMADIRHILVHAQTARKDQLERMARLGVTPSFFSAHIYYWGDRHEDIFLGPQRASNISPTRWAKNQGLRFSVHLDTPVVPMNPRLLLWSTVVRRTSGGVVLGPDQRLSVMEALRAMTIDAAWQIHQEDRIGSLETGKMADLVVLSEDPRKSPERIREIAVERTVIGGVTLYPKQ